MPDESVSKQEFIIDRIFPSKEVHLTGGASGSGKTTLEAQLIEEWRQGRPVYGYKSHPAPFCYVACDRSLQSIQATLVRVGVDPKDWPLLSLVDHPVAITLGQAVESAKKVVPGLRVLWLDGIHSLCPKGKINDYDTVQTFLTNATRLCQKENITIKGLGHATKVREGEEFQHPRHRFLGSVAWGGYSDTMTIIDQVKPEDPKDTRRNVYLLPRNAESELLVYEIVEGKMSLITDAGECLLDRWLLKLTPDVEFTTAQVVAEGKRLNISESTAKRWLRHAESAGKILKVGHGVFKPSPIQ